MADPKLIFEPHPSQAHTLLIRYGGYTNEHIINLGNGKTVTRLGGQVAIGDYSAAGWYRIEAWDLKNKVLAGIEARVLDALDPNFGTWGPNPDNADFFQIEFADLDGSGIASQVDIDWGDGHPETVWAIPGESAKRALPAGRRDITITDHGSRRKTTTSQTVTGRVADPDATIELDPADKTHMTGKVTIEAFDTKKGAITVWWDQGVSDKIAKPAAKDVKTHKYTTAGTYPVVVEYSDGSSGDNASVDLLTVGTA